MEVRIALLGGVVPAIVLGLAMLAGAWITRQRRRPGDVAGAPSATTGQRPAGVASATWAWVLGFALAIPFIHFASWSWPQPWPKDVSARLIHSAGLLACWGVVDLLLALVAPRGGDASGARATRTARTIGGVRWIGRGACVGLIVGVLAHAYLPHVGWVGVALGVGAASVLALLGASAMASGQRQHHPSLVWATQFVAALGAAGVLILGRTATGGQGAAGLGALAAATSVALLLARGAAPGPIAPLLWTGTLAWLLALGVYATGQTNIASAVLIMAAPLGWLLPRRRFDLDLLWKRVPLTILLAVGWSLVCVAAAVVLAVLTQSGAAEEYSF